MEDSLSASDARAGFFGLLERLARAPDEVVLIRHRDLGGRFVLMTESRWRGLEAAARLRRDAAEAPFRLQGSAELLTTAEQLDATLGRLAEEWDEEVSSRLEEL
ncbi:MAG: hypothetical protein ACE5HP_12205 [Gemmatimonadota bacterium]